MTASRLTLLLLFASVSRSFAVSTNTSWNSLKVCSAPSCLFRNGTECDRTRQECPRCVLDDPLLGTPICTAVGAGKQCRSNFTLCPATPLETTVSSDVGYHPAPLTMNITVPSPSPDQRMITNNMPMAAEGMLSASESPTSKPTWKIAAIVVGSVGVVGSLFIFVHVHRRQRQPKDLSRDSLTPLTPPPSKNEDAHDASFKAAASPPNIGTFESVSIGPKQLNDRTLPTHPPMIHDEQTSQWQEQAQVAKTRPSTCMSDLAISLGPDSYRRHTGLSDTALFMESGRSAASADCWDVDDIALLEAEIRSRKLTTTVDDDEVDIYPDTAITVVSERGRMFSPKTRRVNEPTNFTTFSAFSVDDDDAVDEEETYPETSLSATRSATGAGALEWDVVDDVWESHREVSEDSKHALQQQQIAQWKTKYRS
jgi:hypothetical protein